jgi:vacuolar-type H+-ATPase subunit H
MKEKTLCFKIKEIITREEDKQTIIFDYDEETKKWVYHAPNAQDHTEEQVETILNKLKELNNSK